MRLLCLSAILLLGAGAAAEETAYLGVGVADLSDDSTRPAHTRPRPSNASIGSPGCARPTRRCQCSSPVTRSAPDSIRTSGQ